MIKNKLLKKKIIKLYDYTKLRNKILEVFQLMDYVKLLNNNISIPKITSDYRVRYNQFIPVKTSAVENFVFNKLMLDIREENVRRKLFSKITISLRKLNNLELEVFNLTYYKHKSEDEIMESISYGREKIREIKKSASIKFLIALSLDKDCYKL